MSVDQRIVKATEQLEADVQLTHEIVHGSDTTEVSTEGGKVPSHAKVAKDSHDEIIGLLQPTVEDINEHAKYVNQKATESGTNAERAETAANNAEAIAYEGEASLEPKPGSIPIADSEAKIHHGWLPNMAVPYPDFWLPLNDSLKIEAGFGPYDQIDVSPKQDGSMMVDLPTRSARFSRASKATYINKSGKLCVAEEHEPRFEKEGILIEGSSTNLLPTSVIKGGGVRCVYSQSNTSFLDGYFSNYTADSDYSAEVYKDVALLSSDKIVEGTTYSFTVFFNLADTTVQIISLRFAYGISTDFRYNIETGETTGTSNGSVTRWGNLLRLRLTGTYEHHALGLLCRVQVRGQTPGDVFSIQGAQLEELPFASSYIPTEGTPVTRGTDFLSLGFENNRPEWGSDFTVTATGKLLGRRGNHFPALWTWGAPTTTVNFNNTGAKSFIWGDNDRVALALDFTRSHHYALTYCNESASLIVDRSIISTNSVSVISPTNHSEIMIGGNTMKSASGQLFGHAKDFRIWHQALTVEQIKSVA